jgi:hypothetical protein
MAAAVDGWLDFGFHFYVERPLGEQRLLWDAALVTMSGRALRR